MMFIGEEIPDGMEGKYRIRKKLSRKKYPEMTSGSLVFPADQLLALL